MEAAYVARKDELRRSTISFDAYVIFNSEV